MKIKEQKMYSCEYCGKQYNTKQARGNHSALCPLNPTSK